jgi:hypothetical protein
MMAFPQYDLDTLYYIFRKIGRVAFPIYCFLLVEGFVHTRDRKKYLGRMLIFALISEIPFDLAITGSWLNLNYQNVFWELALGIVMLMVLDGAERKGYPPVLLAVVRLTAVALFMVIGELAGLDYGMYGILSIAVLYLCRYNKWLQAGAGALTFVWELPAPVAFLPILAYNQKRGRTLKYVFYIFYPAHLLILYIIARMIGCPY